MYASVYTHMTCIRTRVNKLTYSWIRTQEHTQRRPKKAKIFQTNRNERKKETLTRRAHFTRKKRRRSGSRLWAGVEEVPGNRNKTPTLKKRERTCNKDDSE